MERLKKLFRYLLYISIGFVVYYLLRFDYLVFDEVNINWGYVTISLFMLFAGFLVSGLSWRNALKCHGINITNFSAINSHGISVFAKYIPGKIWVILGRASIVSEKEGKLAMLTTISLKEQLVFLLVGLILGGILLYFIPDNFLIVLVLIATVFMLSLFLFSKKVYNLTLLILRKITNKSIDVPFVGIKGVLSFMPYVLVYWILWGVSFWFLCRSIVPDASFYAVLVFPLASCYGLLAVFVPGGIGVREGIIVLLLSKIGISVEVATTISVMQRIWFICGEVFIFLVAFILGRLQAHRK